MRFVALVGSMMATALAGQRYADYEYNCTGSACSSSCESDVVATTKFDSQEDFFERVTECIAKNPGSAFDVRAGLTLKPFGCPTSNRVYVEIPKEMEDFWTLPEGELLELNHLGIFHQNIPVSVGFTSSATPCKSELEDVFPSKQKAKSIRTPDTAIKHTYLVLDAASKSFKAPFKSLTTSVVAKQNVVKNFKDDLYYYCQAGCCSDSEKCSNSAMRTVFNQFAHMRRANACATRYSKICNMEADDSLDINFSTKDVFLCNQGGISLYLNFTSDAFGPAVGRQAILALVPDPSAIKGGSIEIGASNRPCGADETAWFTLNHLHDDTFTVRNVSDFSFRKPYAVLKSSDIPLYDVYNIKLPFTIKSTVPQAADDHPKFNGA